MRYQVWALKGSVGTVKSLKGEEPLPGQGLEARKLTSTHIPCGLADPQRAVDKNQARPRAQSGLSGAHPAHKAACQQHSCEPELIYADPFNPRPGMLTHVPLRWHSGSDYRSQHIHTVSTDDRSREAQATARGGGTGLVPFRPRGCASLTMQGRRFLDLLCNS